MKIAKWVKLDFKKIIEMENDKKQLLVFNHITDRWFMFTAFDIYKSNDYCEKVQDGFWDVYELVFVGKEICSDEVDLQDELDMIDDGIFNYNDKG